MLTGVLPDDSSGYDESLDMSMICEKHDAYQVSPGMSKFNMLMNIYFTEIYVCVYIYVCIKIIRK